MGECSRLDNQAACLALCPANGISVFTGVGQLTVFQVELPVYTLISKLRTGRCIDGARIYFLLEKWISKGSNGTSTLGAVL